MHGSIYIYIYFVCIVGCTYYAGKYLTHLVHSNVARTKSEAHIQWTATAEFTIPLRYIDTNRSKLSGPLFQLQCIVVVSQAFLVKRKTWEQC